MAIPALRLVLFVLVTGVPLAASDIEGQVRAGSDVVTRATVQLLRDRVPVEEHPIGSNGQFEFRNLNIGSYSVRVRAEGFLEEEVGVLLIRNNSRQVILIELRPLRPNTSSNGPATAVSVADYQIPRAARREFQQGYEDRKRGQCAKAIPHLQKAIAAFERYGDAFNELGHCLRQAEDLGKAEESFKKAIEYSDTIYPSMNLADLYEAQKRFGDAHEVLRQSMLKHPAEGDLHFAMARVHFDQGRLKEAAEAGLEAHSRVHRAADVHILLAKIYLSLQNYPAVESQLRLYLDENPKGPLAGQVRKSLADLGK